MATYKKRGNKSAKQKVENQLEEQSTTAEVFSTLDEGASRTEEWVARNQKYILGIIGVIVVGILGYLAYNQFVQKPKEREASNELFFAQQYFDQAVNTADNDSLYNLALNGGEGKYGLLDIIDKYSGTKAANLAKYSAGMAYLNMNKYQEAVSHLEGFSSDDEILGALAKGGLGDAFAQLNQLDDALNYYEKAISHSTNDFTTPRFLLKAGKTALSLNQYDKAAKFFNRIKEEFPNTVEGRDIDTFIGKAETLK
ncbi:tetratricopeptide repeat protein [Leptobacterium flavescens]|uniref:Tetratricopeptide repeat protein n=1 Tax=Leptobacterium flavescens TaxID=472055 RepID=A0A6P0UFY1_9FLAO|nr:tetratricopeptide repeat protein [Leptobacterium flavescens]NER12145.1 tetratricopeptide repeat protein [Leptobacterium flavescens]